MTVETTTPSTVADAANGETVAGPAADVASAAGEDWRTAIEDAGARRRAERYASLNDYASAHESLVRKLSDAVFVPDPGAGPEEIAKFRRRMGVPETPEGYDLGPADEAEPAAADAAFRAAMAEAMHTANVPAKAAVELNRAFSTFVATESEAKARDAEAAVNAARAALEREWGADHDRNLALARRAASRFADDRLVSLLEHAQVDGVALGDHPLMVQAFARIGRAIAEDTVDHGGEGAGDLSLQERIAETRRRIERALATGDTATARALDREERQLWVAVAGEEPVVGRGGRAA